MPLAEDADPDLQGSAAVQLAASSDRTADPIERVGPLGPGFEHDHRVSGLWWWERWKATPDGE
ncbi:hypothetical protein [Streptomyces chartreusis]|uniref:hypothetical protein n=1 Tax=Streptomyces chartreusis TaxID=1969 RepID=UPI00365A9BCC